jgi:flagellar biosynthesis protein FliQ
MVHVLLSIMSYWLWLVLMVFAWLVLVCLRCLVLGVLVAALDALICALEEN